MKPIRPVYSSMMEGFPSLQSLLRKSQPPLTREQERAYFEALASEEVDPEAKELIVETLVLHNIRLVMSIGVKWAVKSGSQHLLEDMVQEGLAAVVRNIPRFDITRGFKFSTFITWWIDQAMMRYLDFNVTQVRIPIWLQECIRYRQRHGEDRPVSGNRGNSYLLGKQFADLRAGRTICQIERSIDQKYECSEEYGPLDEIAAVPSCEEQVISRVDNEAMIAVLQAQLTPSEYKVLAMRWGLEDGTRHTLNDIGVVLGVTRERSRQIEDVAIRKAAAILRRTFPGEVVGEIQDPRPRRSHTKGSQT